MNKKKIMKFGFSLALVGAVGIGATLAYLQTGVEDLTNTFTIGDGYDEDLPLILDEDYNGDDEALAGEYTSPIENVANDQQKYGKKRTMDSNTYTIYPGTTVHKDPQVSLKKDSPESYVFVAISGEDQFGVKVTTTVNTTAQDDGYHWMRVNSRLGSDDTDGIYVLAKDDVAVKLNTKDKDIETDYYTISPKIFDQVQIENMTDDEADTFKEDYNNKQIKVWAVAVQASDIEYSAAEDQAVSALETAAGITSQE